MQKSIHLRVTSRSEPLFHQVEEIAKTKPFGQFTPALLDIVELGLDAYKSGKRLVDNEIIDKPRKSIVNIENEVARSLYTSLAGSIADLERYEESKLKPSLETLNLYILIGKALWYQHAKFSTFTDAQIRQEEKIISKILKSIRLSTSKEKKEQIIQSNIQELQNLIAKTGVKL